MPIVVADRRPPANKPAASALVANGEGVDAVFDVPVGPKLMGTHIDAIIAEVEQRSAVENAPTQIITNRHSGSDLHRRIEQELLIGVVVPADVPFQA